MPRQWPAERGHGSRKQQFHAASLVICSLVVSLGLSALCGCRTAPRESREDPAEVFEEIHGEQLRGNLADAQQRLSRAQKTYSATNAGWNTKFRILQAQILTDQGDSPEVLALLHEPNQSPPVGEDVLWSKTLSALAYARVGQPQQSERDLREAQSLSTANNSAFAGEILLTRGLIEWHYHRLPGAASWFEKSAQVSRQKGDKFLESRALTGLGGVAVDSERYDEAVLYFRQTSDLAEAIHAQSILETSLGNQGNAYLKLGDFEKSLVTFQQAEKQAQDLGSTNQQIEWFRHEGLALYQLHSLAAAEDCYGKAMQIAVAARDQGAVGDIQLALGFLSLQQDKLPAAKMHSEAALEAAKALGDAAAEPVFLEGLVAAREPGNTDARNLLMHAYQMADGQPSLRRQVENAIANQYADSGQPQQATLWYQKSIQTFEAQRSTLNDDEQKLPFFANADGLYKDYSEFLIRSHRESEALQLLDLARARTLEEGLKLVTPSSDLQRLHPLDPRSIARKLDSTILFYSLGLRRSYLWSINATSVRTFQLPSQSEIEGSISNYQKAILKSDDPLQQSNGEAQYLYQQLVAPAASSIAAGSRVIVIPDGGLNLLNFETLIAGKDKPGKDNQEHYWIEDVALTDATSIRMLSAASADTRPATPGKLLLIGDAISAAPEYAPLANASVEVKSVEEHFAPASRTVITRSRAVPAAYSASNPGQFSYIHFVAHATASRLSPLDSAVVLSAPAGHPDTYKLYARDIVHQPLHAELVTISSCYGSGSRAYAGEGMVGLSWAFLRAGSHHVIAALWEADDASTAKLMDSLYGGLGSGERPDTALREAKLALIHSAGIYRKPYYWAAFQLQSGS